MGLEGGVAIIAAEVPLVEMFGYANAIRRCSRPGGASRNGAVRDRAGGTRREAAGEVVTQDEGPVISSPARFHRYWSGSVSNLPRPRAPG